MSENNVFVIDVPGFGELDLAQFKIDDENILEELSVQPGWFAYWSSQESFAYKIYQEKKLNAKIVAAERYMYYRLEFNWAEVLGGHKPTMSDIKAKVESDKEVFLAEKEMIEARFSYQQIKAVRETLQQRKDMLSSTTGYRRSEMAFGGSGTVVE